MSLSKLLIIQFQQLYFAKFNETIEDKVAEFELKRLAELVRIVVSDTENQHE